MTSVSNWYTQGNDKRASAAPLKVGEVIHNEAVAVGMRTTVMPAGKADSCLIARILMHDIADELNMEALRVRRESVEPKRWQIPAMRLKNAHAGLSIGR
jgi:hypothetical protein